MNNKPKHKSALNDDAFDREAAEGFGLLGSEEEIAALKAETDKAFSEQFEQNKTNKAPWLWIAAALVIGGLGITVFSVLSPNRKMDLAQAPSTEQVQVPSDAKVSAETDRNTINEKAPRQSNAKADVDALQKTAAKPQVQSNANSARDEQFADMEESAKAAAEPLIVAAEVSAPAVYASSPNNNNTLSVGSAAAPVNLTPANDKAADLQKEYLVTKKQETKALRSKTSDETLRKEDTPSATASTITYKAGEKQLEAKAKELLKNIQLPKEIEVSLNLDTEGRVLKAEISSKKAISPESKLAGETELKKLTGFVVEITEADSPPFQYRFSLKR